MILLLFNGTSSAGGGGGTGAFAFDPFGGDTIFGMSTPFAASRVWKVAEVSAFDQSVDALTVVPIGTLFDAADLDLADGLLLSVEGQTIRWSATDTDPTTTTGHKQLAGTDLVLRGRRVIADLKLIAATGTAKVQATLLRTA